MAILRSDKVLEVLMAQEAVFNKSLGGDVSNERVQVAATVLSGSYIVYGLLRVAEAIEKQGKQ